MIVGPNVSFKLGRKRRLGDPRADFLAAGRECLDVAAVEILQLLGDAPVEPTGSEEFAEGIRRGGEAAGDADASLGQAAGHLAKRTVLAADLRNVGQPQIL